VLCFHARHDLVQLTGQVSAAAIPRRPEVECALIALRPDQPHLRPGTATPILGYGYQTWILPTKRRMFLLWGVRGQRIFVDPENRLVMVNTAVHTLPFDLPPLEEMAELWFAVVRHCS
jgi:CubicO group peptidase (beta-lactamase class C family)